MKTIILVGGGHSHLYCLKKHKQYQDESVKWILISPSRHQYYSGMFSGYTEGMYSLEETRIDLEDMCAGPVVNLLKVLFFRLTLINNIFSQTKVTSSPTISFPSTSDPVMIHWILKAYTRTIFPSNQTIFSLNKSKNCIE